jgi:hypothetical protein
VRGSGLEARLRNLRVRARDVLPARAIAARGIGLAGPADAADGESWRRARPFVLLVVGGVAFYVLSVFGAWRSLAHLDRPFAVLVLACEVASFVCVWELDRITLRMRPWLSVIAA